MSNPVSTLADALPDAIAGLLDDAPDEPVEYDENELLPHIYTCITTHTTHRHSAIGEEVGGDEMGVHFEVVLDGEAFEDVLHTDTIVAAYDLELVIETSGRVISDDDNREFRSETSTATVNDTNEVTIHEPMNKEAVIATHDHDIPAKGTSHVQFTVTLDGTLDAYDGVEEEDTHIGSIPVYGKWDVDAGRVATQIRGITA